MSNSTQAKTDTFSVSPAVLFGYGVEEIEIEALSDQDYAAIYDESAKTGVATSPTLRNKPLTIKA